MRITLCIIETKKKIILDSINEGYSVYNLKKLISNSKQNKTRIDNIQLFTKDNIWMNDEQKLNFYGITNNSELKMKIDNSLVKVVIEIFQKNIEKTVFNVAYTCSIFLLKNMIFNISQIPVKEQMLYYNSKVLKNEETLLNITTNYEKFYNRSKSVDMTSISTESSSSPRSIVLKMMIQRNKNISFGLDFSFNYLKNVNKVNWNNEAPSFREIEDGLSLICYCKNTKCQMFDVMAVSNLGKI